jgi:hypothetical protein
MIVSGEPPETAGGPPALPRRRESDECFRNRISQRFAFARKHKVFIRALQQAERDKFFHMRLSILHDVDGNAFTRAQEQCDSFGPFHFVR